MTNQRTPQHSHEWQQSLGVLRKELPDKEYNTWIAPLQTVIKDGVLYLHAPNIVIQTTAQELYYERIDSAVRATCGDSISSIMFGPVISEQTPSLPPIAHNHIPGTNNHVRTDPNMLEKSYTLKRFVVGESNRIACGGAKAVIDRCRDMSSEADVAINNPFFMCGGVGLGKTHLMHAIGHALQEHCPEKSMLCTRSEDFVSDFVGAVGQNAPRQRMEQFKQLYRNVDVLLIDDVQFFLGKSRSQEELMSTMDDVLHRGGQVVLTCDRLPNDLRGFDQRLRSKFQGALIAEITAPDTILRTEILRKKAQEQGTSLNEDIAQYIAEHITSNVRELEGVLQHIVMDARTSRTDLSMDMAQKAVRDMRGSHAYTLDLTGIQNKVCRHYSVSKRELLSASRSRSHVLARHVAMKLGRELTQLSYPEIASAFGSRDHSSVIYGCRRIDGLRERDSAFADTYNRLFRELSD